MVNEPSSKVVSWVDLVFKLSIPVLLLASFYLNSKFSSKDEISLINDRLSKTETAILLLAKDNEVNSRQDSVLTDHETRIRFLENRR